MAPSKRNTENHTHSFDVIHLPGNVACPKEIAEANLPNGDVKQVLLLYDTGATMTTGTHDVVPLDQRYRPATTGPVITTGVNSKLTVNYDHVEVWLGGGDGCPPIRVPVNCRGQSKTDPPPKWTTRRGKTSPTHLSWRKKLRTPPSSSSVLTRLTYTP